MLGAHKDSPDNTLLHCNLLREGARLVHEGQKYAEARRRMMFITSHCFALVSVIDSTGIRVRIRRCPCKYRYRYVFVRFLCLLVLLLVGTFLGSALAALASPPRRLEPDEPHNC